MIAWCGRALTSARALARALVILLLALVGCRNDERTVLLIVVTLEGSLTDVAALDVSLSGEAGTASNHYTHPGRQPIVFPTTLTAELAGRIQGEVTIDVKASDSGGGTVARGREGPFKIRSGTTQTLAVRLDCGGARCAFDGGAPDGPASSDASAPEGATPSCGNGVIDPGESCDVAIADGEPGACPSADCDDGVACTNDLRAGEGCTLRCAQTEVTSRVAGDGCCPTGATSNDDSDCSVTCGNGSIEAEETCDLGILVGQPGACPTASGCTDNDPCAASLLVSRATCAARCLRVSLTAPSGAMADGCCPVGARNDVDADCPAVCGDGVRDPGETCDPGIPSGQSQSDCPATCDDRDACTLDLRNGSGCQVTCARIPITSFTSGDGCCPPSGNSNVDRDCPPICGNSVLEEGEACDPGRFSAAPCPTVCSPRPSACVKRVLVGSATACTAGCAVELITTCSPQSDGCCPVGCTAGTDSDCAVNCGDGVVQTQAAETCDTAITAGPGICPTQCSDGVACTRDILASAGTCQAICVHLPVTDLKAGDGCCPAGGHFAIDPDCAPVCGNGMVETPVETCDFAVGPAACAVSCPASMGCTVVSLRGAAGSCSARCVTETNTTCRHGDGCCPASCSSLDDDDCSPVCGNGVLEAQEICDKGITAGRPGACAASCNDHDACTADLAAGTVEGCTRTCWHAPNTGCADDDRCCPPGCSATNDRDCIMVCGDGTIGGGETCDPPSSCPAACPDDGDRCTLDRLDGDPLRCTAVCLHTPITACSGTQSDRCCPTGCTTTTDVDC